MNPGPRSLALLDQAATLHRFDCEGLAPDAQPFEVDPARTDEAVMRYGLAARGLYGDLRRVIGQAGGLMVLAQASARREAFDLPSLAHAEDLCREARDRLAGLEAPGRLAAHRDRLAESARLAAACLSALRDARLCADGGPDLAAASAALSRAYGLLQSASDSRFGMTMVDFRYACCNCGALKQ